MSELMDGWMCREMWKKYKGREKNGWMEKKRGSREGGDVIKKVKERYN